MKKLITVFLFILIIIGLNSVTNTANSQVWEKWVARYNGPADSTDIATSMTVDKFGNVYVTGTSFNNETAYDYLTFKYNAFGNQEWVRSYNGSSTTAVDDKAVAIAVDKSGNVIVTGNSKGEYTTIKYNSSGTQLWVARYDELFTLYPDSVTSLAVDTLGNIYITGTGIGLETEGHDYQTIKYNSLGEMQWISYYNTSNTSNVEDRANSIAVDVSGNVYVTGKSVFSGNYYDIITVKYNSSGIEQWVDRYNGQDNVSDEGRSIKVDGNGNVYVFGVRDDYGSSAPYNGLVLIKYNLSGQEQWVVEQLGLLSKSQKYDNLAIDESGNSYFTCRNGFPYNYSTFKYNTSGVQQWVSFYSSLNYNDPRSIAVDPDGNVYVTGITRDVSSRSEYATVKYNSSGIEQWDARYNGPGNFDDEATSIAYFDGVDNVYVTGTSSSVTSNHDFTTIKYSQTPALTGTLNIPGDYPDLAMAILDLNKNGVGTGGVTLNLISGNPQTAPSGGYVIGGDGSSVLSTASAASLITIQGNGNTVTAFTPQSAGLLTDAIFKLIGADYVTITGFTLSENSVNTIDNPGTNDMTEWGIALLHVSTTDGCQNNTIQNNNISLKRIYQNSFGIYSNNRHSASSVTAANDVTNSTTGPNSFNKVYGNNISDVNYGTVFIGSGAPTASNAMDKGNDIGGNSAITGNTYTNWGGIGISPSGYLSLTTNNFCIFMNNQYNDNVSYNSLTSANGNVSILSFGGILKDYSGGTSVQPVGSIFNTYNNNKISIKNQTDGWKIPTGIYVKGLNPTLSTSKITINSNLIFDCESTGSVHSYTTFDGILNESRCGILNISNNIIRGISTTSNEGHVRGITNSSFVSDSINIRYNKLGDSLDGFVTFDNFNFSEVWGITNFGGNQSSAAYLNIIDNDIRGIIHLIPGYCKHNFYYNNGFTGNTNISNNKFTGLNINSMSDIHFIFDHANFRTTGTIQKANSNSIVEGFTKPANGGTVYFYSGSDIDSCITNNFSDISLGDSTTLEGWRISGSNTAKSINNNVFKKITCGSRGDIKFVLEVSDFQSSTIESYVSGNFISGINCGGGNIVGILVAGAKLNLFDNNIDSLFGKSVIGIKSYSSNSHNIYRNKLNSLSGTSATGVLIDNGGTTYNISNNLIGNLLPTTDSSGKGNSYGVYFNNNTAAVSLINNTILMSSISLDSLTSTGVYASSLAANLTMKNNLIQVQNTGSGKIIAYRNSGLTGYNNSSNNNLYYAGTPSPNNLIFSDGGSNNIQTLSAYKTFVSPRDSASVTEDPNFISLNSNDPKYLHIDSTIASQIESGGTIVAGINNDYDLQPRYPNAGYPNNLIFPADNPDIGADEFGGKPPDYDGPVISYSILSDSCGYNSRSLNAVTINDPSGVAGDSNKPRIYWKVNTTGTWASAAASNTSSPYSFTIGASGLISGDSIFYFVIAQDNFNNVSASPGAGLSANNVNTISVYPSNPNFYVLNCWLTEANFEWVREYYLNYSDNKGKCVAADLNGNSIVSGTVLGAGRDIVTLKYNPSGTLLWSRIYANPLYNGEDHVNDLITDESGNIYLTGFAGNSVSGEGNILTIKYNPSGDTLWVKKYNGSGNGNDEGNSIALDGSGNILVTGYSLGAGTNNDFITIKYDNIGNMLWDRRYGYTATNDIPNNISADDNGNIYVTGLADFAYLTLKYNSAGDLRWHNSHYATGGGSGAVAKMLDVDKSGNVYVTGISRGLSFTNDYVTIKYDSLGNQTWLSRYNSTGNGTDEALALKLIYENGNYLQPKVIVTGTSKNDFLTLKYEAANGNILWEKRYDGPSNSLETVASLAVDAWGNAYITGHSYDNATNYDFVTIKYSANNGDQLWYRRYNSYGSTIDDPSDIALATDGSVFVTGRHNGFTNIITTVKYKQPLPPPPPPLSVKLTALIYGLYNDGMNKMIKDTVCVFLRNISSPYTIVDSAVSVLDSTGKGTFYVPDAANGSSYYIVVKHRNSIETWSASGQSFVSGTMIYDFTTAANKAYGNNLILKGSRYCIYSGDVNLDGNIDLSDVVTIYNDVANFVTGYTTTDVNGDNQVDLSDVIIAYNNSVDFVSVINP